ncbi:MAG: hypothetical protein WHV67_00195 [Thermoanaerobaculia bacterium]
MKASLIYAAEIKDQKAEKPVDKESLKRFIIIFFLLLPFFVLSYLTLKTNLKIYGMGKEIRKLEYESKKLEDKKIKVLIEKEKLLHPEKIEEFSKKEGLVFPDEKKVVVSYEP